ncbi:MAG: hypothetical protein QOK40_470 [Miltoncostaeaceae bacterium]|nr:hypothetical protein [Miltoncostaeaceae bacterium]
MTRGHSGLIWRGAALLAAGTLAVHQLRFVIDGPEAGHGDAAGMAGHATLSGLAPWLALLLAAAAGGFLARLARARRGDAVGADLRARLVPLWAAATGVLIALHAAHELLEGLVMRGGPDLQGLLATGGLSAVLAALVVGGFIALALRGARALIRRAASRSCPVPAGRPVAHRLPPPRSVARALATPLAGSAAGRAPPGPVVLAV